MSYHPNPVQKVKIIKLISEIYMQAVGILQFRVDKSILDKDYLSFVEMNYA